MSFRIDNRDNVLTMTSYNCWHYNIVPLSRKFSLTPNSACVKVRVGDLNFFYQIEEDCYIMIIDV